MSDMARDQAKTQLSAIVELIDALEFDFDRLEELRDNRMNYSLVVSMSGCLPDSEPVFFNDIENAKKSLIEEIFQHAEELEDSEDSCCSPISEKLRSSAKYLSDSDETSVTVCGMDFSIVTAYQYGLDDDEYAELLELEEAAEEHGYDDIESVEQAIYDSPLEILVRSGWHEPSSQGEPEEFKIVLCIGGPHVEIRGELDIYGYPSHVRLVYKDWDSSGEYYATGDEYALLLAYCCHFLVS